MTATRAHERGLEAMGLTKSYGSKVALDAMDVSVGPGEILGFVGANGAGKSTTMRAVMGVLAPDAGTVLWNGKPATPGDRKRFGYMPEERGLYPKMLVGEQLEYLALLHGASKAGLSNKVAAWCERLGIAERLKDDVQSLSLGNQQRVQLAAALVYDPVLLVLDEPFSGLDPVAVDVMAEVLSETARAGTPVVFSSHQLELVERLCDRVAIARAGRVVAAGTVDALRGTEALQLVVDGPPPTWDPNVPGVEVLSRSGSRARLSLSQEGLADAVIRSALAAGSVREVVRVRPSLTDLFRDVVAPQEEK